MSRLSILALGLIGCQLGGDGGSEYTLTARDIWRLQVKLDQTVGQAGQPVGLEVTLLSEDGEVAEVEHWALLSNLEDRVQYTRSDVFFS